MKFFFRKNRLSAERKFILDCLCEYKLGFLGLFFVSIFASIDLCLRPYLLKLMVNAMIMPAEKAAFDLSTLALFYIGLAALSILVFRIYDYSWLTFNSGLKKYIGLRLMKRMMLHSQFFYQNQMSGGLSSQIKEIMSGIPDITRIVVDNVLGYLFTLVIAVTALWTASPEFSIGLVIWTFAYLFWSGFYSFKGNQICSLAAKTRAETMGKIGDVLANISTVKLFNGIGYEIKNLGHSLQAYVDNDKKRDWFFLKMSTVQGLSFIVYQGFCLFYLVYGFKKGVTSPGDFALVLSINISIVGRLTNLSNDLASLSKLIGDVFVGLKLVYTPLSLVDSRDAKEISINQLKDNPEIEFSNVTFSYIQNVPVLENISLHIKARERIGIVGYSGVGKTTFINLLQRLFDVTSGAIKINHQDIRQITQSSLHDAIGVIPQDTTLFHRSLREIIHYGRMDACEEEIIEASKAAGIHDFIESLPQGYDSFVGERGIKLSGGQRQKISIARAFLKDAPILIMDEPTSQLDSITEVELQKTLLKLMKNKTTLIIAHRISTLTHMDRILVFDKTHIVEDGPHDSLLKKDGLYTQLWKAQINGMVPLHNNEKFPSPKADQYLKNYLLKNKKGLSIA